jgi:hypothetical protein
MPALSQGLQFSIYNSTSSVAVVYPNNTGTMQIYYSEPVKGDGYYGSSDGLHTVMYTMVPDTYINFIGTLTMQASLAAQPVEGDWFSIDGVTSSYNPTSNVQTTQIDYYNFTGNFVWVRGVVAISAGTASILYNH